MAYNPNDYYFKKAKADNYVARSVYKLQELDVKYKLLTRGNYVIDLGAAPGSWSQYASEKVGTGGKVFGIDLQPLEIQLPNVLFVQADIHDESWQTQLSNFFQNRLADVVISDMAPKTTGVKITDQARSHQLCQMALQVAQNILKPQGSFVCKFFDGPDFNAFRSELQQVFTKVATLRVESTRKSSKELFFIGLNKTSI